MKPKIYIIGAGISGLTTAYYLQKKNYQVEVYEASKFAGGRCRSYFDKNLQREIDNGNHLILQANSNILSLINELNLNDKFNSFDGIYKFYDIETDNFFNFKPNLLGVAGLISNFKILNKIYNNISTSILNTLPKVSSNKLFLSILLKILRGGAGYYYPKINWSDALINKLAEKISNLNFNHSLKKIEFTDNFASRLIFDNKIIDIKNDILIIATPQNIAMQLLNQDFSSLKFNAITNIHFKVNHNLKPEIIGILSNNQERIIDWIFIKPNIISTTKSADISSETDEYLIQKAWKLCQKNFPNLQEFECYKIIKEKRASFSCENNYLKNRPKHNTQYKNIFLTGDYIQNNLPATIEGAVLNGLNLTKNFN